MAGRSVAHSCPPAEYLPPVEFANGLYSQSPNGKWIIHDKMPTPLDEFGRVDGQQLMSDVFSYIDPAYRWTEQTNVHHLQFPRRAYTNPETTNPDTREVIYEFRENAPRQMWLPIQAHNLLHKVAEVPPVPSYEVMYQHVAEYRRVKTLFQIGRRAINFGRWSRVVDMEMGDKDLSSFFNLLSDKYTDRYEAILETAPTSQLGVMPDVEMLQRMNIREATAELGKIAAVRAFDFRRQAQSVVSQATNR